MAELMVITVPPESLPVSDQAEGYAVILGDCILPGHYLGRYPDVDTANNACQAFAMHYRLKAYLMTPHSPRAHLRLILGGKASK